MTFGIHFILFWHNLVLPFNLWNLSTQHISSDSQKQSLINYILLCRCGEKEFMDSLIKKVVVAKEINHKGQGLWVSLKVLQGDVKQVCNKWQCSDQSVLLLGNLFIFFLACLKIIASLP